MREDEEPQVPPGPTIQVYRNEGQRYGTCRLGETFMVFDQTDNIPVGKPCELRLEAEFWASRKNRYGPWVAQALQRVQHQVGRTDGEDMAMFLLQYMEHGSLEALAKLGAAAVDTLAAELDDADAAMSSVPV